ncbi:MAG TPA: amino acid adenylation domain-containing protein [Pyrinomonadaceae bacterium]
MSEVERRLDGLTEEQKRELLLRLLAEQAGADGAPAGDDAASASATAGGTGVAGAVSAAGESGAGGEVERRAPLSYAQQRLWFLDQLEGGRSALYNIPMTLRLVGELDAAALGRAFAEVARRHEALRTTFEVGAAGRPEQVVRRGSGFRLEVRDLSALGREEAERQAGEEARREAARPFDLREGPLARATLLRLGRGEHVLCVALHHIVSDGWSTGVLVRELAALYGAYVAGGESPLPPLPVQYADYARRQREWLEGEELERQLSYWRGQLGGGVSALALPRRAGAPAAGGGGHSGAGLRWRLGAGLTAGLRGVARREGATPFMALLAGFQVLLWRYTGQEEVAVGTPIANRKWKDVEGLIGFFVNTLVLRTDLSGAPTFRELLGRVREVCLRAYEHQDVPFERVVAELAPRREAGATPLFQVMFALQNATAASVQLPGISVDVIWTEPDIGKFDLSLVVMEEPSREFTGWLKYNPEVFDESTIRRMSEHYQTLLEGIVANPDEPIWRLPMVTSAERQQMSVWWDDTKSETTGRCLHELFEAQAERSPEATAVACEGGRLTYRELNLRANALAHRLRARGVGPEVLVGVLMERSSEAAVAALAVLKAGGAYVPLDSTHTREELGAVLRESGVSVLLTVERLGGRLPADAAGVVNVSDDPAGEGEDCLRPPHSGVTPANLACVVYATDSAGGLGGSALPHGGVSNAVLSSLEAFGIGEGDRVLQLAPFGSDVSVWEMFAALLSGAALHVAPGGAAPPDEGLQRFVRDEGVTAAFLPSSVLTRLPLEGLTSLRTIITRGDSFSKALAERWSRGRRLFYAYGAPEASIFQSFVECREDDSGDPPTVGRPAANLRYYALDGYMQPVPVGAPAELYIGGAGLARGYLNRPGLTAERFVPDPFTDEPGARLYRSGEPVSYRPDGNLDFAAHVGRQAKIRRARVPLGEVEAALRQHPAVREAAVIVREDHPDDKQLVGYVVCGQGSRPTVEGLQRFLTSQLPDHMIPSAFVHLDALPRTRDDRVDRRALPPPDAGRGGADLKQSYVAPRTENEAALAAIFSEVLGKERVGVNDNFFILGGHSLLATQAVSRIRERFKVEMPLRRLFEAPTVAGLAEAVARAQSPHPQGIDGAAGGVEQRSETAWPATSNPPRDEKAGALLKGGRAEWKR